MALSPIKSHQSPLSRSRSSSCSSPIRNTVVYREIYSVGASTLVRSYSCDQVLNRNNSGQTFQTTKIQISSFLTSQKSNYSNVKTFEGVPFKPVILDKNMPSPKGDKVNSKVLDMNTKKTSFRWGIMIKCILLPIISAIVFYNYIKYKECGYVWDIGITENELKENVFGQNEALLKISTVLNMCNTTNDFYTLIFTGGVGVGKTFTSSIISHNFPWSSNKLITYSESFKKEVQSIVKNDFSSCGCNLLIVDDLSSSNLNDAITLISSLTSKRKANEKFLTILIFQVHSEQEKNIILRELKKSYIHFYHIHFKNLDKDVVRQCYEVEIKRRKVEIPDFELEKLIQDKLSHIDIVKGTTGCKGVSEEVSYYHRKLEN